MSSQSNTIHLKTNVAFIVNGNIATEVNEKLEANEDVIPSIRPESRIGKISLSHWVDKETRIKLALIWLDKGILRVNEGMDDVIELYIAANSKCLQPKKKQ